MGWHERYEAASEKFKEAQYQYRFAESALARATAALNVADRELHQIYQERAAQVNATP